MTDTCDQILTKFLTQDTGMTFEQPESEHSGDREQESDEMASDPEMFEKKKHRYML